MSQASFGELPGGDHLDAVSQSPHYEGDAFRSTESPSPIKGNGDTMGALIKYVFSPTEGQKPAHPIPSMRTNLRGLDKDTDTVVWLGHSTYFVQLGSRRLLIDPVFSTYASPILFANRTFEGTNPYTAEDMPDVDYLLISHGHWDRLDYATATALRSKVGQVACPLGVGIHFEAWGYGKKTIFEEDWYSVLEGRSDSAIHILPARHFSGRSLARNETLWAGFALVTPERRIFFSGDSGYGKHFAEISAHFDGFGLATLGCGRYNESWRCVYMMPEDTAQAAEDLRARALLPGRVGKFAIAHHTWDDPLKRIVAASRDKLCQFPLPLIGEPVTLPIASDGESLRWWGAGR